MQQRNQVNTYKENKILLAKYIFNAPDKSRD